MKIAVASPFEEKVPPLRYGGTELVVSNVVENLVAMGHDVTLLATGDSQTAAHLVPIFKRPLREIEELKNLQLRDTYKFMGVGKAVAYLAKNKFDVIHNNIGWRLLPFEEILGCPVVTTLHGPLDIAYQQRVYGEYRSSRYISISLNQRKPMPELNFIANVYNGIDISKFRFYPKHKDYFAFLGRMSPEKGPVQAIKIAKAAGVKLVMAAKVDAVDEEYFRKEVEPLIDEDQIKFVGEVDHEGKLELLGNAKALLAPIQWEEPFGLFFVEAMACGTPVISMRRGSVPEIILDKKTGFICDSSEEAVEKIKDLDTIDRKFCFDYASDKFSAAHMAENYLKAYEKAVKA